MTEMTETTTERSSSDSPTSSFPVSESALERAESLSYEGDLTGEAQHEADEDPARDEAISLDAENRRQCRGFATSVIGGLDATLGIAGIGLELTEEERRLLGEAWGDVLRHYVRIKDGTERGDWMAAVGESSVVLARKKDRIKEIARSDDTPSTGERSTHSNNRRSDDDRRTEAPPSRTE